MQKKTAKIAFATATSAILLLSSCTIRQAEYSKRTVSVHGTGAVTVEADNATITMSVITRGENVAQASFENAEIMDKVQKAILNQGISNDNVTTENYSVYQETRYENGQTIPVGYRVTNQVKVFVKDIDSVGGIIDAALTSGANQLSSLQYGITDTELAVKQARTVAVQQAQEAAQLIAGTSGAKLGKVLKIEESANQSNRRSVMYKATAFDGAMYETMEDAAPAPTPIQAGKSIITVNIDAIYELK